MTSLICAVERDVCDGRVAERLMTSEGLDPFSDDVKSFRDVTDLKAHHIADMSYQIFNK